MKLPAFLTTTPSIGDFICSTPTIKKLAKTYGTKVLVISPNPVLLKNNPYVSESINIDSVDVSLLEKDYDIHRSFHLLGKRDSLGIEFKHAMCDIRQFHAKDLGFMLTPNELSCDYFPDSEESCMKGIGLPERYVVIHPAQSWDSRTWDIGKWQILCDELAKERIFIVAIGKNSGEYSLHLQQDKPVFDLDIKYGIDLTNKTTLDQSWHIMNRAQIVVTMDSGILHLAGTTDTYIIQLGSSIDPYYRAPYRKGSQQYKYKYVLGSCRIHCASDLSYSLRDWHSIQSVTLINTCLENKKEFECKPGPLTVLKEVVDVFNGKNEESELDYFYEIPTEVLDLRSAGLNLLKFDVDVDISFRYGPKVVINGDEKDPRVFNVNFIDDNNQEILHESSIRVNHWTKASIKYYTKWRIVVSHLEEIIHEEVVDLSGKNVMVSLSNTALGDSVAWLPYCEEFRKLHDCILTVETPHHKIFSKSYPEIEWVPFGDYTQEDDKFYATYEIAYGAAVLDHVDEMKIINKNFRIGKGPLFSSKLSIWDKHKIPRDPHTITLAEIATDALGMKFREIRPNLINPRPNERPYDQKFVCISEFASSPGLKIWNNKIGWEKVVDKLTSLGFKVVSISKEKSNLKNVIKRNGDIVLSERIWYLHNCEFFIGVSSGLSWLAWACGKKVVMISGATLEFNEFQEDNIRIINKEACHGCWNSDEHRHKFACFHGSLCPENKNFECTRKISPNMVIDRMHEAGLI
jgi:ADP-heptose:LPS heptosyltransferase